VASSEGGVPHGVKEAGMSALRRAGVWLGLIEDEDDNGYGYDERGYDDDYSDDERSDPSAVVRARVADRLAGARAEREAARLAGERADRGQVRDTESTTVRAIARPVTASAAAPMSYPTRDNLALKPEPDSIPTPRNAADPSATDDRRYQITTLHPTTFNEARTIGEQFRDGVPVIINLTDLPEADAKRLVDFAAGLAFGLRGSMERVTNRVFLLSPANIQVTAEDKAKIAEGGFFHRS